MNLLKFSLKASLVGLAVPVRPNPRGCSSRGVSRWISSNAEKEGRAGARIGEAEGETGETGETSSEVACGGGGEG